jgi:hypothetical protein
MARYGGRHFLVLCTFLNTVFELLEQLWLRPQKAY